MAETAKWYVVHTYSGYENKVATNLEKTIRNRRLQDYILEVKVPTETVTEIKDNKKREVERKVFPGYVLVKMIITGDTWYVIRNTRGVTGFVGPGSEPVPLTEEDCLLYTSCLRYALNSNCIINPSIIHLQIFL